MKRKVLVCFLSVFLLGYVSGFAYINSFLSEGYQGLAGNSIVDIIYDGTYIWIGTPNGLSKFRDDDTSWTSYDKSQGLNENSISALTYADSTLWVAESYDVLRNDQLYPFGASFNTTRNFGQDWDTITADQASGYGRICYDIAEMNGAVWAACWYGGLVRSKDNGHETWENVFPNLSSQQDWELGYFERLDNKFFSVVVDTSPPQSYLDKNFITKMGGRVISDTLLLWIGTKNGLHFSFDTTGIWIDPYDSTYPNFQSNSISSVKMGKGLVWAGIYHQENDKMVGAGIQRSEDYGANWTIHTPQQASSDSQVALDITSLGDSMVCAACWNGGLIQSRDSGSTWSSIFVDSLAKYNYENEIEDLRNRVYAVAYDTIGSDSLIVWSGTEAGIFKFVYTSGDSFDTVFNYNAASGLSGDSVFSLAVQKYNSKKIIWAGVGPKAGVGNFGISKSEDGGNTWQNVLSGIEVRDFGFSDSVIWIATNQGLKRSLGWGSSWDSIEVKDASADSSYFKTPLAHRLKSYDLNTVLVSDSIIWVGGKDGLARSTHPDSTWTIYDFFVSYEQAVWTGSAAGIFKFIYNHSDSADTALQYAISNNLTGNFVVALTIQKYGDKRVIWAATNPTYSGTYGISKSDNEGKTWTKCLEGTRVWNFAFQDSIVWAATDSGLERSFDYGENWEVFNYMKDSNDTLTQNRIFNTTFYSVCLVKDTSDGKWTVWAGNVDGLVRSVDLDNNKWQVFRSFVPIGTPGSETAYAYPSPFSPMVSSGGRIRIHHRPLADSYVTIKVYDFAMNLVTTIVDNQFRYGGRDYDEPWDARNDRGALVANGVYFFRMETSSGQKEWGKLVILK
jgi:hypothetical protein